MKDTLYVKYQNDMYEHIRRTRLGRYIARMAAKLVKIYLWYGNMKGTNHWEGKRHRFTQGCINLGDKIAMVTKFGTVAPYYPWVVSVEQDLYQLCGVRNFEVISRYLERICTTGWNDKCRMYLKEIGLDIVDSINMA
jgi:hypothetical protein